jgi:hypothetical protein
MAIVNLKSPVINQLDTVPTIFETTGSGGPGFVRAINSYLTTDSGDSSTSTYKFVRLPTTAVVKHVLIEGAAETAGTYNAGVYYSDAPVNGVFDGTPPSVAGTVVNATLFASAYSLAAATAEPTDIVNQAGNYPATNRNQPLWQAAGLASDPGGFFDLTLVDVTGVTTGGLIGIEVEYVL